MGKRIVIALGGNALGSNLPEQMIAVKQTAKAIVDLIEEGHEVIIAHGNGPQVGMIQNAFAAYHKQQAKSDIMPLSMCVAMSQGYIGYHLHLCQVGCNVKQCRSLKTGSYGLAFFYIFTSYHTVDRRSNCSVR